MDVIKAAQMSEIYIKDAYMLSENNPSTGKQHLYWMVAQIRDEEVTGEKAHSP